MPSTRKSAGYFYIMIQKILLTATLALSFAFTSAAQNAKEQEKKNKKEACSDKFDIEEDNIVITNDKSFLSGYFAIRFDAKSDVPTMVKVIMKVSDCKANVSYISVPMLLDSKLNLWVGKGGIPHLPGCTYSNEDFYLIVTNECDDEFSAKSTAEKKSTENSTKFKKLKSKNEKGYEA